MVAKEEAYKELGRRERREKQLRIAKEKLEVKNQLMVSIRNCPLYVNYFRPYFFKKANNAHRHLGLCSFITVIRSYPLNAFNKIYSCLYYTMIIIACEYLDSFL